MSQETAVSVKSVSKSFRLPHERSSSIKGFLIGWARGKKGYEKQQVLDDVSFEIPKGEFFGIVGRNGSGKSTLLKLLAGIYTPDSGEVQVNGKLTPFIELGVGFNPELTGRENVFLNGALLGFNRAEMSAMYDDIVAFAELERFMDQKLKNYSSGMQVRLAFSIAIRVESDILLLDEVLAVGDESFQRKCIDVFEDYKRAKQTIILVTHDMEVVKRFCTKAMLVKDGEIIDYGDPHTVADEYSRLNQEQIDSTHKADMVDDNSELEISLADVQGKPSTRFDHGDTLRISVSWPASTKVENAGVAIYNGAGVYMYGTNTFLDGVKLQGDSVSCDFTLTLGEGRYYIVAGTFLDRTDKKVDFVTHGPEFMVNASKTIKGEGVVRLEHTWKTE